MLRVDSPGRDPQNLRREHHRPAVAAAQIVRLVAARAALSRHHPGLARVAEAFFALPLESLIHDKASLEATMHKVAEEE